MISGGLEGRWESSQAGLWLSPAPPSSEPSSEQVLGFPSLHPWASLSHEQKILGLSQLMYSSDPTDDGFSVLERALQAWGLDETCQNAFAETLVISL